MLIEPIKMSKLRKFQPNIQKRLTYTTFRSSVYRVWKSAYNSKAYLNIFQTFHNKIEGNIELLSLSCI